MGMDNLTKEQRRKNMQRIKSKDTKIELILRKALWKKGIRYRKNYTLLEGKPDIVITKYKIVVFCDSEFFHGFEWNKLKEKLESSNNSQFWIEKIERNRKRDKALNEQLTSEGWIVLRFWGKDIIKNTDECVRKIESAILKQKSERI
jgi:DNA mismatch endonuclease (patch repair protein)